MLLSLFPLFENKHYSKLVKLIYGRNFYRLQAQKINSLQPKNILIIGIGDGEILNSLKNDKAYTIVECSSVFCGSIKEKIYAQKLDNVKLIESDFFEINIAHQYDLVVCPFFLDLFNQQKLNKVLGKISSMLKPNGELLVIDFKNPTSFFKKFHLNFLYQLFRITDGIKSKTLSVINSENFLKKEEAVYKKSWFYMLEFRVYAKNTNSA